MSKRLGSYEELSSRPVSRLSALPAHETQHWPFSNDSKAFPLEDVRKIPAVSITECPPFSAQKPEHNGRALFSDLHLQELEANWQTKTWKTGVRLAVYTASLALMLNFGLAFWTLKRFPGDVQGQLVEGDCTTVLRINKAAHFVINLLSTALLSGSIYCMQCLSAPSRHEVDKAHEKRRWLDIGVPSVRNLRNLHWKKVGLWGLLGLSSVPLHFLFNSAVYTSIGSIDYNIIYATQAFVDGGNFDNNYAVGHNWQPNGYDVGIVQHQLQNTTHVKFEYLTNAECIQAYGQDFVLDRQTLVIVANGTSSKGGISLLDSDVGSTNYWICLNEPGFMNGADDSYDCSDYVSKIEPSQWQPGGFRAEYCLSERVPGRCSLHVNTAIIWIVVVCNIGKLVGMTYLAVGSIPDPLITVGDALTSFLERPDATTSGICLATKVRVMAGKGRPDWVEDIQKTSEAYRPTRKHWFRAGLGGLHADTLKVVFKSGNTPIDIIKTVLLTNTPQVVLSTIYLNLNGILTSMFMAEERSHFATERKPLHVTSPRGQQRGAYFLQLPYRISIPLMVITSLLHLLLSETLFLLVIMPYSTVGEPLSSAYFVSCGFSIMGIILVLVAGIFVILFALGYGCRTFRLGMPLVGSCSAAISAACHGAEPGAAYGPVQWGVMSSSEAVDGCGHCGFSGQEVTPPIPGRRYAGLNDEARRRHLAK